jgi:protein-S-isoprenylcysteine O-methyltransferase Ste14
MIIRIGHFFFRYRNGLFPLAYVVLFFKSPRLLASPLLAAVAGVLMAGSGQLLRAVTIGSEYIPRGGENRQVHAEKLVQDGIYAHCRNPLYLGNLLILLGLGLASNSLLFLGAVFPFFLFAYRAIVAAEEEYLRTKFGDEFVAYCARVNRLIPNLSGIRESLADTTFRGRRFVSAEYGPTYIWLAAMGLVLLNNLWLAGDYRSGSLLVWALWTALGLVTLAYAVARYLKKTGRLNERSPSGPDACRSEQV